MKKLFAFLFLSLIHQGTTAQKTVTLDECEGQFLKNNLFLLASYYNIEASKALTIHAKIWENPVFTAEMNAYNPELNQFFILEKWDKRLSVLSNLYI